MNNYLVTIPELLYTLWKSPIINVQRYDTDVQYGHNKFILLFFVKHTASSLKKIKQYTTVIMFVETKWAATAQSN